MIPEAPGDRISHVSERLAIAAKAHLPETLHAAIEGALNCSRDALMIDTGGSIPTWMELRCDRKWCASCSRNWSEKIRAEILPLVASRPPENIRHLVLTIKNARHGQLAERIDTLYQVFREWRNQGRRKSAGAYWKPLTGYAWKLEIDLHETRRRVLLKRKGTWHTYEAGWHPHLHVLLDAPKGIDLGADSDALRTWRRLMAPHIGHATAPFVTRPTTAQGAAREVAKYAAKPLQIAYARATSLAELVAATHGRRYTGSQGTLGYSITPESSGHQIVTSFDASVARWLDLPNHLTPEEHEIARQQITSFLSASELDQTTRARMITASARRHTMTEHQVKRLREMMHATPERDPQPARRKVKMRQLDLLRQPAEAEESIGSEAIASSSRRKRKPHA